MIPADTTFTILEYFGIWRPITWSSKWAIRFYNIYNCFVLAYIYLFGLSFLVSLSQNFHDIDLVTENLFFFFTLLVLSFKITYTSIYREDIISFKNMLLQTICIARDDHEMAIQIKFHETSRSISRILFTLCLISSTTYVIGPLAKGKNVSLPFRTWVPYSINSRSVFWITYIYQTSVFFVAVFMFVPIELLASAMMQRICAQLEIIKYRLLEHPESSKNADFRIAIDQRESNRIRDCIIHHDYMFTIGKKLNELFGNMVFVQFFANMLNLCTLIYQLSKMSVNNVKFWSVAGILTSYSFQIFLYCWYGDEMIEKSLAIADAAYKMNWPQLSQRTKHNLIIIMVRASRPIELSGASIITMSVDTFVKILKSSYSAFNLLASSQH